MFANSAAAYMEMPVLVRSLKSSILRLTSSQTDQTFSGVVSATVGRLGLWGVHLDTLSPLPGACGTPFGAIFSKKI